MSFRTSTGARVRWSQGFGLQDIENNVAARAATVYRLGSISKPITDVAVMRLFERGRLDLDAPAQKYCPAFPEKQWPVTTHQLLGHLAGVRHYKSDEETAYGLGRGVGKRPTGERTVGHSGGQQRVSTFLHMRPEQGLAVVIMSNLGGARLGDLAQQVGDAVLK